MSIKPKILLVEDDEIAAYVTAEALSRDYLVRHVDNGQAALHALTVEIPDLVLLDVDMPGMSGYEVCSKLRQITKFADLPVIFLSGMDSQEAVLAGYAAGGSDFLAKPVTADELCAKIKRLLDH